MSERTHDEPNKKRTAKTKSRQVGKQLTNPKMLRKAVQNPRAARPEAILRLQQSYGNRAVRGLIQRATYLTYKAPGVIANNIKRLEFKDIKLEIDQEREED